MHIGVAKKNLKLFDAIFEENKYFNKKTMDCLRDLDSMKDYKYPSICKIIDKIKEKLHTETNSYRKCEFYLSDISYSIKSYIKLFDHENNYNTKRCSDEIEKKIDEFSENCVVPNSIKFNFVASESQKQNDMSSKNLREKMTELTKYITIIKCLKTRIKNFLECNELKDFDSSSILSMGNFMKKKINYSEQRKFIKIITEKFDVVKDDIKEQIDEHEKLENLKLKIPIGDTIERNFKYVYEMICGIINQIIYTIEVIFDMESESKKLNKTENSAKNLLSNQSIKKFPINLSKSKRIENFHTNSKLNQSIKNFSTNLDTNSSKSQNEN